MSLENNNATVQNPEFPELPKQKSKKTRMFVGVAALVAIGMILGSAGGAAGSWWMAEKKISEVKKVFEETPKEPERIIEHTTTVVEKEYLPQTGEEQKVIGVAKTTAASVVSIVISKEVPVLGGTIFNPTTRREKQEVGGGTGFIVSKEGMVVTNKHVVRDKEATYTIITSAGDAYPAIIMAKDPLQDIAVLKIDQQGKKMSFIPVKFGDSFSLEPGQTVVAVGNALGEYKNTISTGVISGLGRTITASDGDFVETIEDVIQTDAAINQGNSGGPLLNLAGEVIGMNTATVIGAQSIGFAIPIREVLDDIESVKREGQIVHPLLGIRYRAITRAVQQLEDLPVDYGVLIVRGGSGEPAIDPRSAAAAAGLKEGDIIVEVNGQRISKELTLGSVIKKYKPDDRITLKVLRNGAEQFLTATLGEIRG